MDKPLFNIITRCTRPHNLPLVKQSIFQGGHDVRWYIYFNCAHLKDIDAELLASLDDPRVVLSFKSASPGDYASAVNDALDKITSGWVYILDDDNKLHEDFYASLTAGMLEHPDSHAFVFNQLVDGKDFTKVTVRKAAPSNTKVQRIDAAQFCVNRALIGQRRFKLNEYKADGYFIQDLFADSPDTFVFLDTVLAYYNGLSTPSLPVSLPKVLLCGEPHELVTQQHGDFEESRLNVIRVPQSNLVSAVATHNPAAIVTIGGSSEDYWPLCSQPPSVTDRWIHAPAYSDELGTNVYKAFMHSALTRQVQRLPLVSFFTPLYNTGPKIYRAYDSLCQQTYTNWEWVLVNDSTDQGRTLKLAEIIAANDPRVKLYDFRNKSGGLIGEAKYRAAALASGKYIMELDHDDMITEQAAELMVKAFQLHPECKFVFSDCAEVTEDYEPISYGENFCFGYGKYRNEIWKGREYQVAVCQNINPLTIRHSVGVPNHFRAWDRKFYHSIGGHNRRLAIADDYELLVRTFLSTRLVGIRKLLYVQFYHSEYFHCMQLQSNTQTSCRADIQRRVRTISEFYNEAIKERFDQLGLEDWAYNENPSSPLNTPPRFGEDEQAASYIWTPE